ncbi:MAG: alcohol dehydrogenase [Synergistaceae bacterium]|jgi:ribosomal protein S27AE|nr:alcohol dehydrogenase [Synergistaceae bacterium]
MLIVGCQSCGEAKVLAGTPDMDGVARMNWTCPRCGAGQVLQLEVASGVRLADLHSILGGMPLRKMAIEDIGDELREARVGGLGDM